MAVQPGYNFLRGRAKNEAVGFFKSRFADLEPTKMSVVSFLRHLKREEPLPHQWVSIEGYERLYEVVGEEEWAEMSDRISRILSASMNRLMNDRAYICFMLDSGVTFQPGPHVNLRLEDGRLVDLYPVFGSLTEMGRDHYHSSFNVSS